MVINLTACELQSAEGPAFQQICRLRVHVSSIVVQTVVKKFACVNDCAERGVALMQTFNQTIAKDEDQNTILTTSCRETSKGLSKVRT